MPRVTVRVEIEGCEQHAQLASEAEDFLEATIETIITVNETQMGRFPCRAKLTVGERYPEGTVEVTRPEGYTGPYDHEAFSRGISDYYRRLVASLIWPGGPRPVLMQNNYFRIFDAFEFEAEGGAAGW
ncbi:hypothetical protein [Candidatus Nitrospira bockiana]